MSNERASSGPPGKLRSLVERRDALLVPGAANALTARIIEDLGFDAAYLTGAGLANTHLGMPDLGLTTVTELAETAARITDVCSLPLIVDIDTGFGNALNVYRTVALLERAGAAALQIEDQIFPKKCGHFSGKGVIPLPEMLGKLKAALDARTDANMLVIARTDARAVEGFERALERAHLMAEAGADVLFVEAPETVEEMRAIAALPTPQVANIVVGGRTPNLPLGELRELGFAVALYANAALQATIKAVQDVLGHLKHNGSLAGVQDRLASFAERQRIVDKDRFDTREARYSGSSFSALGTAATPIAWRTVKAWRTWLRAASSASSGCRAAIASTTWGVLALGIFGPSRDREGGRSKERDGIVQRVQAPHQKSIVRSDVDRLMENEIVLRPDHRIARQGPLGRNQLPKRGDVARSRVAGRQGGRRAFEHLAHVVELGDSVGVECRDDEADARHECDEPLPLEPRQRRSDGSAADAEPFGELDLAHAPTRRKAALQDFGPQCRVRVVGRGTEAVALREACVTGPVHHRLLRSPAHPRLAHRSAGVLPDLASLMPRSSRHAVNTLVHRCIQSRGRTTDRRSRRTRQPCVRNVFAPPSSAAAPRRRSSSGAKICLSGRAIGTRYSSR